MLLKGTGSFPPSTGTKDPNLPPCANGADAQSRGKGLIVGTQFVSVCGSRASRPFCVYHCAVVHH